MASANDIILEEFGEHLERSAPNPRTSALSRTPGNLTESFSEVSEHSRDRSCSADGRREQTVVMGPLSISEINVPISVVTNEPVAEQQTDEQVEESRANFCITAIYFYKKSVIKFRNSAFMYIVQLVLSSIPISSIVMGVLFAGDCPKLPFLPVFVIIMGAMKAILLSLWVFRGYKNRRGISWSDRQHLWFEGLCSMLIILTIFETCLVVDLLTISYFTSAKYCSDTFYTYGVYKECGTAVALVLLVLLYLPELCRNLCSHNCPTLLAVDESFSTL